VLLNQALDRSQWYNMVKVKVGFPTIRFNEPLMRASLSAAEFDELDLGEVYEKYGSRFIIDEPHLIITTNTGIESTLTTTDFLNYFSVNLILAACDECATDIPFWEWKIFDSYVVVSVWCGGSDGGLIIIDAKSKPKIIAATPETIIVRPENIIFAPKHKAFICSGDMVGFDELTVDLTVINVDGRIFNSYIGLLEEGEIDSGTAILEYYSGPYLFHDESWLRYVEEEDLLIFSILNDYRNKPVLLNCRAADLLKRFGMLI
jgi:hypothetical protein